MNVRHSIYGPLSVGLALLGLGVEAAITFLPVNYSWILWSVLFMFLLGIGFGITGMVREEPLRWLPAIGFGFNIVLILIGSLL